MRRSVRYALAVTTVIVLVLMIDLLKVPQHLSSANQQATMAEATTVRSDVTSPPTSKDPAAPVTVESAPATQSAVATPVPANTPTATPSPTPTAMPTATPQATPNATPTATATNPAAGPVLVQESNGMKIGCESGPIDQYLTCEAQEPLGFSMTFYLYLPQGFTPNQKYPLVLLLEGGGERAVATNTEAENRHLTVDDPYAQVWGPGFPGQYSEDVQGRWPCFVVIPQPLTPGRFVDVPANYGSYKMASQPNDVMRMSKEIVDTLQLAYRQIDAKRLYLTGLSMGGYGAWEAAERWPNYWAAVAPIAGAGDLSKAHRLVHLPIWAFHNADDDIVPVSGSRDMIQSIRAAGGDPKYTEFASGGHGAWLAPYTIMNSPTPVPDFFSWLFAQHK